MTINGIYKMMRNGCIVKLDFALDPSNLCH